MITQQDLQEAIAECEGQKNPNANTCIKLAAFYTIRYHMFEKDSQPVNTGYSYAESSNNTISYDSGTEFSDVINGMNYNDFIPVIDELMSALQVLQPKLYDGVIRKLNNDL